MPTEPQLSTGGALLWADVTGNHDDLDAMQLAQLEEACRAVDRLDRLDVLLTGASDVWDTITDPDTGAQYVLTVARPLEQANATGALLRQLLAALRLSDVTTGRRPQRRGGARGAYRLTGVR